MAMTAIQYQVLMSLLFSKIRTFARGRREEEKPSFHFYLYFKDAHLSGGDNKSTHSG